MRKNVGLFALIKENYALIMDSDKNPLQRLPAAQRSQIMIYLSVMWTTIFCAAFGVWFWYGELILAHILIVVGLALTGITFSRASRGADGAETGQVRTPLASSKNLRGSCLARPGVVSRRPWICPDVFGLIYLIGMY